MHKLITSLANNLLTEYLLQHQLLESFEEQHEERLQSEREREHRALDLIEQLREEEKYVVLRLQALKFHQEFIKRGLSGE